MHLLELTILQTWNTKLLVEKELKLLLRIYQMKVVKKGIALHYCNESFDLGNIKHTIIVMKVLV